MAEQSLEAVSLPALHDSSYLFFRAILFLSQNFHLFYKIIIFFLSVVVLLLPAFAAVA